ncbi:AAA family ATPase [Tolypothrix campylonemoides VB511288]|nr:AAA family ATPase [Tolypothrix campylonemoides VB511288]
MLKQLILENWKSFRYAELPIDPLTVLIGTNASGKSNVVEALEFLQRIVRGEDIEAALAGDKTLPSIRGGVEWAALKNETQFTLKAILQGEDENPDYLYSITVQTKPVVQVLQERIEYKKNDEHLLEEILINDTKSKKSFFPELKILLKKNKLHSDIFKQVNNNVKELNELVKEISAAQNQNNEKILQKNNQKEVESLTEFLVNGITSINTKIKTLNIEKIEEKIDVLSHTLDKINLISSALTNIFILNPIPSKMRDYSLLSDTLESDASNIAGVLAALPEKQKAEVEETISAYAKNLPEGDIQKIWAEKIGRFGTDAMLYCEELWKPGHITEIDARSMSDGTLRFIAILTALLTRPEGSQLVIEEIDNGLHPSRAELLVRMLREIGETRKIDILITTHNPALLDALGPEIVPFVVVAHRDSETGESKLALLEDIENLPKLMASGTLGKLATKGAIEKSLADAK